MWWGSAWRSIATASVLATFGCSKVLGITDVPPEPNDASVDTAIVDSDTPSVETATDTGSSPTTLRPPARPSENSSTQPNKDLAFAVRRFRFGQNSVADPKVADSRAWTKIGFDIDGVNTTAAAAVASEAPGTCRRVADAPLATLADGESGRDNSFGSNVFPLMDGHTGGVIEQTLTESIANGSSPTLLLAVYGIGEGESDTFASMAGYLTQVTTPAVSPKWDGSDTFVIDRGSLKTTAVIDAKLRLIDGYVAEHTFVSGEFNSKTPSTFYIPIGPKGFVPVQFASLTFVIKLDPTHERALSATLVGVIEPTQVEAVIEPLSELYLSCSRGFMPELRKQIHGACDVSLGKKDFFDPSGEKACDAISIAIDLDLERVQVPTKSEEPAVLAGCDAGADGGS